MRTQSEATANQRLSGRDLREMRESLGLSHSEFAAVAGISPVALLLQELGLIPVGTTLQHLTAAFVAGFRPANWPAT